MRSGGEAARVRGGGEPRRGGLPGATASHPEPGPQGGHGPLRAGRGGLYAVAIRTARAWGASTTSTASTSTRSCVVDRDRVFAKLDELESYLGELRAVAPDRFETYQRTETEARLRATDPGVRGSCHRHLRPARGGAAAGAARLIGAMPATANLRLVDPLPYLDFVQLMANARCVLTDSGGIQEETTALGVPCLTLRENTERPITVSRGTNRVIGVEPAAIYAHWRRAADGSGAPGSFPSSGMARRPGTS